MARIEWLTRTASGVDAQHSAHFGIDNIAGPFLTGNELLALVVPMRTQLDDRRNAMFIEQCMDFAIIGGFIISQSFDAACSRSERRASFARGPHPEWAPGTTESSSATASPEGTPRKRGVWKHEPSCDVRVSANETSGGPHCTTQPKTDSSEAWGKKAKKFATHCRPERKTQHSTTPPAGQPISSPQRHRIKVHIGKHRNRLRHHRVPLTSAFSTINCQKSQPQTKLALTTNTGG